VTLVAGFVKRDFNWLQFEEEFDIIMEQKREKVFLKALNGHPG
jgi:hypothetical protein